MRTALVTGGSRGLGRALAAALAQQEWRVVVDAREPDDLDAAARAHGLLAVTGDVCDPRHRQHLVDVVRDQPPLGLVVNNAGTLGPAPLPRLADAPVDEVRQAFEANVLAPLALIQELLPLLRQAGGTVVNVSSDAAVSPYPTWGAYGATKAALDQISAVLAEEEPDLRVYAVDPGDMRTRMHQDAFPGEDISDRPPPEAVVPALLRLLDEQPASGRYVLADLPAAVASS